MDWRLRVRPSRQARHGAFAARNSQAKDSKLYQEKPLSPPHPVRLQPLSGSANKGGGMNRVFNVIWNHALGAWNVASEHASRRGKRGASARRAGGTLALGIAALNPAWAWAADLPSGGQVVLGNGQIGTPSASQMVIDQASGKLAINWQSFDIGAGHKVTFNQPGSDSIALNRVLGSDGSTIMGQLDANGRVFLVNPNGVLFGAGAQVNVGALVASTLDISNEDFAAGNYRFKGDGSNASVINQGTLMASDGGAVALLGGTVSNQGVIVANSGTVALAAGNAVTLDFAGDGLLNVQVDEATKDALVENRQLIQADGGQVLLTAQAADALLRTVVNNDGIIEARTLGEKNGKVVLNGGDEGSVQVAGTLDTSATTGQGGAIEVTGANVALADATLDASGATGGGSVKVGGDWQGTGTLTRAQATTVDAASTLKADATHNGDGGTVVVWSDQHTSYQGHISAKGGAQGGDGGQAEVSGKAVLGFTGTVDLSAAHGAFGDLLLDPYDLTISSGTGGSATATADDSTLGADTLEGLLADANVTVSTGTAGSQNGDITVASAVSWDANTTLTLNAAGNIDIDAAITASGESAGLALNYGGTEGVAGATAASGTDYNVNAPVTLSGADATLSINGSDYTLIHSMEQLDAIDSTGLSGHYALAQDLDASDSPYTSALVGIDAANAFTGTFAGLGHAIGNLTISASGSDYVGLFGYTGSGSTLRDVGLQGGSVTGNSYVGGLVGYNDGGSIVDAYATVDVTGAHVTGGLVGANVGGGSILRAYATGWVNATASEGLGWAGGLIGQNAGSISQSYASGGVTGDYYVGGLVGHNGNGTVTDSYALGNVHGQWDVGGLIGYNVGGTATNVYAAGRVTRNWQGGGGLSALVGYAGTVTNGYWNSDTTGISGGLTTAQLQAGLPDGFDPAIWNIVTGQSYPYLSWQFAAGSTPVTLSGISDYSNASGTNSTNSSHSISVYADDALLGSSGIGANGYYYVLASADSLQDSAVTMMEKTTPNSSAIWSARLRDHVSGGTDDLDLNYGWLTIDAGADAEAFSQLDSLIEAAGFTDALQALRSWRLNVAASDFALDENIILDDGALALNGGSDTTFTPEAGIDVGTFQLEGGHWYEVGALSSFQAGNFQLLGGTFLRASGGAGTTDAPWQLIDVYGLQGMDGFLAGHFALANDIDASGTLGWSRITDDAYWSGFDPISDAASPFTGSLDGNGYSIRGLSIYRYDGSAVGLFGVTGAGSVIRDLGLVATVPYAAEYPEYAGYYSTYVYGTGNVGTLAGINGGLIENVQVLGIDHVYSGGVYGSSSTGGLVGLNESTGVIHNAYATTTVTSDGGYAGGLVGQNLGSIENSYATGTVDGEGRIGGLVGLNSGSISASYAAGVVAGGTDVDGEIGGLVGENRGTVANSYASGDVSGRGDIGSLVGYNNDGRVQDSYALGTASGDGIVGGLVGWNGGTVETSFYATTDANGADITAGLSEDDIARAGTPKTHAELINLSTFADAGWSIDDEGGTGLTWRIYESSTTPLLRSFLTAATVTVDGSLGSKTYDGSAASGSLGSYAASLADGSSADTGLIDGTLDYATTGANADDYTLADGTLTLGGLHSGQQGYDISYAGTASYVINKATLTYVANAASSTYGQLPTGLTGTVTGFVNGETQASATTGNLAFGTIATGQSNVGSYAIDGGGLSADNYVFVQDSSNATALTIDPAALTITANNDSKTYGQTANLSGYDIDGLVNGDSVSRVDLSSSGSAATATVGSYTISAANADGSGLSNYDITYVDGTLTVGKAGLTITANDASKTYGQTANLSYTANGLVNGDSVSSVDLSSSGSAATATVGSYTISAANADGSGLSNYDITYVDGTLTVGKAGLTITANDASKTYDGLAWSRGNGVSYSGFVNGEDASVLDGTLVYGGSAQGAVNAGRYSLTASGLSAGNYAISYVDGTLVISGQPVVEPTLPPPSAPPAYGDILASLTFARSEDLRRAEPTDTPLPYQVVASGIQLPEGI